MDETGIAPNHPEQHEEKFFGANRVYADVVPKNAFEQSKNASDC